VNGLKAACLVEQPLSLETVTKFAPKLAKLVTGLLKPNDLNPLQAKHFVYSSSTSTITALSETMQELRTPGAGNAFRQLKLDDFEWGADGQLQVRHAYIALISIPVPISHHRSNKLRRPSSVRSRSLRDRLDLSSLRARCAIAICYLPLLGARPQTARGTRACAA
jgi:hypothetical protein